VRTGVPHATDAIHGADVAQQVGEQRTQTRVVVAALAGRKLQVAPIRIDVLAEQRDLGDALLGEHLHLAQHVGVRTADLGATHRRHDAERATVVASDLDRDPRVEGRLPPRRER
jgi:hypothetical protein